jgi:hypothetical protein
MAGLMVQNRRPTGLRDSLGTSPTQWRRSAGTASPQIPDSPPGFLESWRGYRTAAPPDIWGAK